MPVVTNIQTKKRALSGAMRHSPEGTVATWSRGNRYQCANGYDPTPDRYVDIGRAGGSGTISPDNTEKRIFVSVPDWGPGTNTAQVTLTPRLTNQTYFFTYLVKYTKPEFPSSFTGFVESAGVVSIEAVHASGKPKHLWRWFDLEESTKNQTDLVWNPSMCVSVITIPLYTVLNPTSIRWQ
ncbi:glycoside hydrolase family 115 protein [Moniliophthora roreri MCA 2997]|uniref:Glycoside hydrolase family 115 protein n=1 Tax=Moniliophthora roreri (strain MCA 2997) TaxID=1381753 RepID=V2XLD3_MONRO|nr:glycoside hydrolase family 115 protein [Moniliophthora roreri MCA 2997]